VDPEFRNRLLEDATQVVDEMGLLGQQATDIVAVENTDSVHNVVVCTLCSCYPWTLLGLPPSWYKSYPYRARVVREPRAVLAEFGVTLDESTEVRVRGVERRRAGRPGYTGFDDWSSNAVKRW
jgi:nitrile hydratase